MSSTDSDQSLENVNMRKGIEEFLEEDFLRICKMTTTIFPLLVPQLVTFHDQPLDCERVLRELILDESVSSIVLMGEGGSGKTSRLVHFTSFLLSEKKLNRLEQTPIFIPLRTVQKELYSQQRKDDLDNFVVNYLFKRIGEYYKKLEISEWLSKQDLLLVLDGYDELEQYSHDGHNYSFPSLVSMLDECPSQKLKVIIGTRKSVVILENLNVKSSKKKVLKNVLENHLKEVLFKTSQPGNVQLLEVLPLGRESVLDYMSRFVVHYKLFQQFHGEVLIFGEGKADSSMYRMIFKEIPGIFPLCSNPNMMFMVFKHLPRIYSELKTKERGEKLELTRLNLFKAVLLAWFEREATRMHKLQIIQNLPVRTLERIMEVYMTNLARQQFERDRMKQVVSHSESIDRNNLKGLEKSVHERLTQEDLISIRDSCLVSMSDDQFMFFHNSVIEYLAMKNCLSEIQGMGEMLFQFGRQNERATFFTKFLSKEKGVLRFMVEKVQETIEQIGLNSLKKEFEGLKKIPITLVDHLFRIIELSSRYPVLSIASSNALTILCYSGVSLSGMDFRGIVARNTVFYEALLDGTDFSLADLTGSRFIRCLLIDTKFNGSCLRESSFEVGIVEKKKESILRTFVNDGTEFTSISPCGRFFASGDISKITIRCSETNSILFSYDLKGTFQSVVLSLDFGNGCDWDVKSFFFGDYITLCFIREEISSWKGNDVYIFSVQMKKVVKKFNSYSIVKKLGDSLCEEYGKSYSLISVTLSSEGNVFLWVRCSNGKFDSTLLVIDVSLKKADIVFPKITTRESYEWKCHFSTSSSLEYICVGIRNFVLLFSRDAKLLCHLKNLNKLDGIFFFNGNFLVLRFTKAYKVFERFEIFRIYTSNETNETSLQKLENNVPRTSLAFSPTKPLYLCSGKLDESVVMEVKNYSTNEVVAVTDFREGEFHFHPNKDILLFGKNLQKIYFREGTVSKLNLTKRSSGNISIGTNRKCLGFKKYLGYKESQFVVFFPQNVRERINLDYIGKGKKSAEIDCVVNSNGEIITVTIIQVSSVPIFFGTTTLLENS